MDSFGTDMSEEAGFGYNKSMSGIKDNEAGFNYNKSISGIKDELVKVKESQLYQDHKESKPRGKDNDDKLMKSMPESQNLAGQLKESSL